jgi:hypothetical protein
MAYGVKYRIEYKDQANIDTKIDIEELDYSGAVTDCVAGEDPLNIEMPALQTIFDPVIALGATIRMVSSINMMFLGLFTSNPKKYRVRIYKGSSSDPFWLGYINTEVHNEPYSMLEDYEVSVACNDGFAILERFKYLNGGVKYAGFDTKWNVLQKILAVFELPYKYLYFACEHTPDDVTIGSSETLFHQLKVDQANYYDESDEAITCLQVLEGLLSGYPLQIRWHDGSLYVYDFSMLADASFNAKKFNYAGTFLESVVITRNLDISNEDCEWDSDDQVIDKIAGNSKQKIRFSPYSWDKAVPYTDLQDPANWVGTPAWTLYEKSGDPQANIYYETGVLVPQGFGLGSEATFMGRREDMNSTPDMYIKGDYGEGPGNAFFQNPVPPQIVCSVSGSSILFKAKVFIRTKAWEYDSDEESKVVKKLYIKVAVEVNGLRPHSDNPRAAYEWIESSTDFFYVGVSDKGGNISDRWIDVEFQFPWNFPAGKVNFIVHDDFKAYDDVMKDWEDQELTDSIVSEVRFKDIDWVIIDVEDPQSGGRIGMKYAPAALDDKEYTGEINEDFTQEAPEITLIHADGINVADRGAIRKSDKSYTSGWRKPGDSTSYLLADILLRTMISQYRDVLIKLSGTLTASNMLTGAGCLGFFNTLQDTDYLSTKKLICIGGVYNDFKRTLNGVFLEINPDDLSVVIE